MIRGKNTGCVIVSVGFLFLCLTLPIGALGLAWFMYDLVRWDRIPYWLLSISCTGLALCLPSLAILITIVGLLILLFSSSPRRG